MARTDTMKLMAVLLLFLAGCAGRQTPLAPAADQSAHLMSLLELMVWVCGGAYALVLLFLAASIFRARRQFTDCAPSQGPDDPRLSPMLWAWGGLVTVGLVGLAGASFVTDWALARAARNPSIEVRVTGHQWWWRIEYRDPVGGAWIETANELHLPRGAATLVRLGSADVIHSFWVPNVAGKMDLVPGRINELTLTPRRDGWYRGQCAEFCGTQHARMAFDVKVESPQQFATWLAAQKSTAAVSGDPVEARGMQLVTEGTCAGCHRLRGTSAMGRAGPDLTHLASRRMLAAGILPMTRGSIQGWILQPRALKPGTMMPPIALSAEEADAVSRYLVSLK